MTRLGGNLPWSIADCHGPGPSGRGFLFQLGNPSDLCFWHTILAGNFAVHVDEWPLLAQSFFSLRENPYGNYLNFGGVTLALTMTIELFGDSAMNYSITTADRMTHLKIVAVVLVWRFWLPTLRSF